MPVTEDGTYITRSLDETITDLQSAIEGQLGEDHALTEADPAEAIIEAIAKTLVEAENVHEDIFRQQLPSDATGIAFDKHIDLIDEERETATKSSGEVNLTLSSGLDSGDFDPLFASGDLIFFDANDNQYTQDSDTTLPTSTTTTTAVVEVEADFLGAEGNITTGQIVDIDFADDGVRTRYANNVDDFNNDSEFVGGQDEETVQAAKQRIRIARASRPAASLDGLIRTADNVDGVEFADGIENNDTYDGGTENTVLSGETDGNATPLIDSGGTLTKVAMRFEPDERRFHQHFTLDLDTDNSSTVKVRYETHDDANDRPSGTLAHSRLEKTGMTPGGAGSFSDLFDKGKYLSSTSTYWTVVEATAGSLKLDASVSTSIFSVRDVLFEDGGTWQVKDADGTSTTVTSVGLDVIAGVPPGAKRIFASGDFDNDELAQALLDHNGAGTGLDGKDSGTAENRAGTQTIYYETPTDVPIVVSITVEKNNLFSGDEDEIKDVIIRYIGGDDTDGVSRSGLGFDEELILNQVTQRVLDTDNFQGTTDVNELLVERKSVRNTPGDLQSTDNNNLSPNTGEKFTVSDTTHISVTLVDQ